MPTAETRTSYRSAIRQAMGDALREDDRVVLLGEDVAAAGGAFKVTEGLLEEFGPLRVTDTPISETGFVGAGIGLALAGFRPIVDLMFAEFAACAFDQIVNQAAKYRYMSNGEFSVPIVFRVVGGAGLRFAAQHSQTTESWYLSVPGLKVVVPSNPNDAYGLLRAAIEDEDPVVFIEHKKLYSYDGPIDVENRKAVQIGQAITAREGTDITIVASLAMVNEALGAAGALADQGISAEVIDIRTLHPMDVPAVCDSVEKTHRLLVVEEQCLAGGWSGRLVADVVAGCFESLDAQPRRLGMPDAPVAFSPVLEDAALPSATAIARAASELVRK